MFVQDLNDPGHEVLIVLFQALLNEGHFAVPSDSSEGFLLLKRSVPFIGKDMFLL